MRTKRQPQELTDAELRDDMKRHFIELLLRQRTWESEDLARMMTVQEVAEALTRPFGVTLP